MKVKKKEKVVFIVGPTAAGKTNFACLLAKQIKGEIVSCDSVSVYRGMDIISSKPSQKIRAQIPHHLIDIAGPGQEYSVAEFVRQAEDKIRQILGKKKVPLIVGGSGLYVDSLLYGLFREGPKNTVLRKRLNHEAEIFGGKELYRRLKELDPESAANIHPNNLRRVIRALEVCLLTRGKFSFLKQKRSGLIDRYDVRIFGLNLKRDELYRRIDERVDRMFGAGLVKEVAGLLKKKLSRTAKQALGIKEVEGYLKQEYDLERAKYLLKRNTRHFAKRQITWFRRNRFIEWIGSTLDDSVAVEQEIKRIKKLLLCPDLS